MNTAIHSTLFVALGEVIILVRRNIGREKRECKVKFVVTVEFFMRVGRVR